MNDTIEKEIILKAPRARVWRALSDKSEFASWFGVLFPAGQFTAGEDVRGNLTYPKYEHVVLNIHIVDVEPERRIAWEWHPYAVDPSVDYSGEQRTLVTFTLDNAPGGTRLRVVESGFNAIPLHRRAEAWRMNDGGWRGQIENIERYIERHAAA